MGYDRVIKGINECLCLTTKLTDFLKKCCHSGKEKPTFKRERARAGPGSYGGMLLPMPGYLISAAHQNLGTSLWIKLNLNKIELVLFTFSDPVLGHIVYNLAEPPSICANMYNA